MIFEQINKADVTNKINMSRRPWTVAGYSQRYKEYNPIYDWRCNRAKTSVGKKVWFGEEEKVIFRKKLSHTLINASYCVEDRSI